MQKVIDWFRKRALRGQFYAVLGSLLIGLFAKEVSGRFLLITVALYFIAYLIQDVLDERKRNACDKNCSCECF